MKKVLHQFHLSTGSNKNLLSFLFQRKKKSRFFFSFLKRIVRTKAEKCSTYKYDESTIGDVSCPSNSSENNQTVNDCHSSTNSSDDLHLNNSQSFNQNWNYQEHFYNTKDSRSFFFFSFFSNWSSSSFSWFNFNNSWRRKSINFRSFLSTKSFCWLFSNGWNYSTNSTWRTNYSSNLYFLKKVWCSFVCLL